MYILTNYLTGIGCIHLFWAYFYLAGSLVWAARSPASASGASATPNDVPPLADLVITTVTGISMVGFALFFLGIASLLNVYTLPLWLLLPALLFWFVRRENILSSSFWAFRLKRLRRAVTNPALIIYVLFLVLAVPAVLPPTLWDSISYHLAYAVDFANAGQINVDQFLRFPYYTNNFLLLDAFMFVLKLEVLCHFLTWLCGLLTCLGVYAFLAEPPTTYADGGGGGRRAFLFRNILVVLSLALSPVFLRYLNVAYVDVPIGLFIMVPVFCVYLALAGKTYQYKTSFILTAAFCVGMKIPHVLLLPLFAGSLIILSPKGRGKISKTLLPCLLLLILSLPWHVRNMIGTGDPLTPTLNLFFKQRDPIFTAQDYQLIMADLRAAQDLRSVASIPIQFFLLPLSPRFREFGVTLIIVLLYLPFLLPLLLLVPRFRRAVGHGFIYLNAALVYLILIWVGIAPLGRYFLHVFPVYICYIGVSVNGATNHLAGKYRNRRGPRIASEAVAVALLLPMLVPTPTSGLTFLNYLVEADYRDLSERLQNRKEFLRQNLPGYASTQLIVTTLKAEHREDARVLTLGYENLAFYFRRNKIVSLGDFFGPGRYTDLVNSLDKGELAAYLAKFRIGAVLVNLADKRISEAEYSILKQQLQGNNFVLMESPEGYTEIYIKAQRERP